MGMNLETFELLLLIATVVALIARRLRLPYTVGLVVTGAALPLARSFPDIPLTRELVFFALLPPLIFEASVQMDWARLRRELPVTLTLATVGVGVSAVLAAAGLHTIARWEWAAALLLGVVLSATDPVSVIALFKELRLHGRLQMLVESESLFNDGTVAVAFALIVAGTGGASFTATHAAGAFALTVAGGLLCGAVVGGGALLLAGATTDHLVEIMVTTVAAYGSFLAAEHFHLSGVLATMACGIVIGNVGPRGLLSERGHPSFLSFWEYAAFVANSLVFLLIGMQLAHETVFAFWPTAVLTTLLILAGRAAAVYGCSLLFSRSRWRIEYPQQHVLFWGGLRGALALALVLGLSAETPHREEIVAISFFVVAFSVVVQGLTVVPLLKGSRAGSREPEPTAAKVRSHG